MRELSRKEKISIILNRDGAYCAICDKSFHPNSEITIDHWIPKAAGGTDEMDNLKLAHRVCNVWKGDRVPNEDGTLPPRPKRVENNRLNKKALRDSICEKCNNGRLLKQYEICNACNSKPEPSYAPHWAKKPSNICSHNGVEWCWACSIGWVKRQDYISA